MKKNYYWAVFFFYPSLVNQFMFSKILLPHRFYKHRFLNLILTNNLYFLFFWHKVEIAIKKFGNALKNFSNALTNLSDSWRRYFKVWKIIGVLLKCPESNLLLFFNASVCSLNSWWTYLDLLDRKIDFKAYPHIRPVSKKPKELFTYVCWISNSKRSHLQYISIQSVH